MKKWMKSVLVVALLAVLCFTMVPVKAEALGNDQSYSYNYDINGNALPAPDPYTVRYRIDAANLGTTRIKNGSGLFVKGDMLYVCDTGNNRILELKLTATEAELVRELAATDEWTLSAPEDIFIADNGDLYIADTGNKRILWLDSALKIKKIIERPDSAMFESFADFKPSKLVITSGSRIYVQATGINRGLMEFDENGEFVGFMGASNVTFNWDDYIWKLLATDAQKEQMVSFVPTEFNNVALDNEGLLYVTTSTFEMADLWSGNATPVRRLNLKGSDILIRNDGPIIGDIQYGDPGPSRFKDVTVLENGNYCVLDTTFNRIFTYDTQGNMLYVFGGYGTRSGYFRIPTALEHWNTDLIVLDSASGLITVMEQTEYGALINDAIVSYNQGDYETAMEKWKAVLERNGNFTLAYDGVGKILLRNGDYEEALDYLEYAEDSYYYSKAWKLYRKDWIEKYLIYIILAIVALVVTRWIWKFISKEKEALERYEERKRLIAEGENR